METSNFEQFKKDLKTCTKVFVWCNVHVDDGVYVEVAKNKILIAIGDSSEWPIRYSVRKDNDMYIA